MARVLPSAPNPHQPISVDRVAASIAKGYVDKDNQITGAHRVMPTREELRHAYGIAVSNAQREGLIYPGTNQLTPKGEAFQAEAAEKFRPEMQTWLENALAYQRERTQKKNMKKTLRSRKNPKHGPTLAEIYGVDLRSLPPARDFSALRRNPAPKPTAIKKHSVSNEDAKMALKRAASETGAALWSGSKWAGERLWAGTKEAGKLAARGARKGAKVGAKYTAKGLEWGAEHLDSYAAKPNPRRDLSRMSASERMRYVRAFKTAKNPSQESKSKPKKDFSHLSYIGPTMSAAARPSPRPARQCRNCKSFVSRTASRCPKCNSPV